MPDHKPEVVDFDKFDKVYPRRVALTDKQISKQLGIELDLLRHYMSARTMHPIGKNECAIFGGLCAEDLASIAITSHMIEKHSLPPVHATQLSSQMIHALLEAVSPTRVMAIMVEANKDFQIEVRSGQGPLNVPKEFKRYTTAFDATLLRDEIDKAIADRTLKLPRAKDCVVTK